MSIISDDIYVKDDKYDLTTSPGVIRWLNNHKQVANPNLLPDSRFAVQQAFNTKLKRLAAKVWEHSPRYKRMTLIVPGFPHASYFNSIAKLPHKSSCNSSPATCPSTNTSTTSAKLTVRPAHVAMSMKKPSLTSYFTAWSIGNPTP